MQTFLPYRDFKQSFRILDWRRLGKQRVEAHQILNVILRVGVIILLLVCGMDTKMLLKCILIYV
jgi:hypothetical protein